VSGGDFDRRPRQAEEETADASIFEPADDLSAGGGEGHFGTSGPYPPIASGAPPSDRATASDLAYGTPQAGEAVSGGATGHVPAKGRVPTDPSAYRPDAVARRKYDREFRKGWNEVREDTRPPTAADPYGGGHGEKATISGKKVGEGGFGARLLWNSAGAAQAHADQWGQIATPVAPTNEALDRGYQEQSNFIEHHQKKSGDPEWVVKEKAYSNAWAVENMETISRYKMNHVGSAQAYNDWVPVANQSHMAQAEIVESAKLMGYDTSKDKDSAAFVMGIEGALDMANQLVDAKVLNNNKQSWSTHQDDARAKSSAQPALHGDPITAKFDSVTHAYNDLQVAHLGVAQALLSDRKIALTAAEGKVSAEIAAIDNTIAFWSEMGDVQATVRTYAGKSEKYAKKVEQHQGDVVGATFGGKAQGGDRHAKKELEHAQDKAHKAERDPTDYRSHIDSHAHHDNYETHHDTWGPGGKDKVKEGRHTQDPGDIQVPGTDKEDPIELPEQPAPPTSIGGVLKIGLTLLYHGKLDKLRAKLAVIGSQKTEADHTIHMAETLHATKTFENALKKFEDEAKKIEDSSMQRRERQFADFGHDLDAYAVEHQDGLKKQQASHLVPGPGREIYATALAVVAKIEKYRSTSKLALGMFKFNDFVTGVNVEGQERSGHARPTESAARKGGKSIPPPPDLPPMSKSEEDVYHAISGGYLNVLQRDQNWSIRLEGIVARFHALMKKIDGSAGDPRDDGSAF
jgi:hypothetical protein